MNEYKLPDVGEGLTEAEIVSWKVKVGDVIKVNDIVVEIETAKSLVELPSPYAGTIQALLVEEGQTVAVGTPIIRIGEGAESPVVEEGAPPVTESRLETAPATEIDMSNPAATGGGENQTLVGYGPREGASKRRARKAAAPDSPAGAGAQQQVQGAFAPGGAAAVEVEDRDEPAVPATPAAHSGAAPAATRVLAKPPVRKLAKDLGVDLRSLTPSGPDGTVTREDVQAAAGGAAAGAGTSYESEAIGLQAYDVAPGRRGERETREPIKGVRKM
ncbi:MAG: biotin/lipoyl-containing protein, partial [Nocardioides sp.]